MGGLSITHILIIFLILLIFFGPGKLPQMGESLGKTIRDFKKGLDEANEASQNPPRTEEKIEAPAQAPVVDKHSDGKGDPV